MDHYYNVLINDNKCTDIIPLTEEEYTNAIISLIDNFLCGDIETPPSPTQITYHDNGYFLKTGVEIQLEESKTNYYKLTINKNLLRIEKVEKVQYDRVISSMDGFTVYEDIIKINGVERNIIGYYSVYPPTSHHVIMEDEGFYVELIDEELSTFEWIRNFGTTTI
jgi:hypothetical protein